MTFGMLISDGINLIPTV
jgi:hypothetical protein